MKLEDLKSFCLRLLERLDSKVDDEYSENISLVSPSCDVILRLAVRGDDDIDVCW